MVRFDISDLRVFVNVVQAGSITRGAERSHRAVASISARIKEMETEMGARLLERGRGGVVPTDAGRKLLGHSYRLLNEVQRMNDDLSEYGSRGKSFVKLCSNTTALYEYLQQPLSDFLKETPGTTLTIEEMVNDQIPQAVLDGRADIGVVAEPVDTRGLETIPLVTDRYVIVARPSWTSVTGKRACFSDFLDYEFVGPGRGTWMHTMLQQHATEHGKPLKNCVQLRSFSMACELVANGVGIGIVPGSSARRMQKLVGIKIIELEDAWAALPLKLCVRKEAELAQHPAALLKYLMAGSAQEQHNPADDMTPKD
ncbi:MAG: LysR substrate-binding domain-containing protein [Pseudomonadota bacterium]